jgi:hypothetical protein
MSIGEVKREIAGQDFSIYVVIGLCPFTGVYLHVRSDLLCDDCADTQSTDTEFPSDKSVRSSTTATQFATSPLLRHLNYLLFFN